MLEDQRGAYFRDLMARAGTRSYWTGNAPDDPSDQWYFETVQEGDHTIAIRQISVSGEDRRGYSPEHLEDGDGFLTDQAVAPQEWGMNRLDVDEFETVWDSRTNR